MKRKVLTLLALIAVLAPFRPTAAATVLPGNAAPAAQQILNIPDGTSPGPYLDEDLTIYNRQDGTDLIQDPLVVYDPTTGKLNPVAATSWSVSPDKLTWTFHIRKGMVWSDGVPLTSEDFANALRNQALPKTAYDFTYWTETVQGIKNWLAVNTGKMPVSALGVANPDPYTLQITTDAPRSYFPQSMVYTWAEPAHVIKKYGNNWATSLTHMVYSGPYMASVWQKGVSLTLVPNPTYHGVRKAPWSKINWLFVTGSLSQFQTSLVSYSSTLGPGDLQVALHTMPKDIVKAHSYDIWYLTYNTLMKPFNDLKVRQAFDLAIDRQTLANDVLKGGALPNYSLLMPGFPGYDPSIKVALNVSKAQALLAAAGYPGGKGFPSITLNIRNGAPGEMAQSNPAAQYIQSELKTNLGISVNVQVMDQKTFTGALAKHTLPLVMVGYNYDYVDQSDFMDLFVTGGRHAWSYAPYDKTVGAADHSFDQAARAKLYEQAQQIMAAQVPASFLYVPVYSSLYNPKFVNPAAFPEQTDDWMLNAYLSK